ncbi:MAG: bifunctional riboflavin kinase/FMN adenylyltransferase [Catenulispora sp. 13_1_20CM_3_70_7]|nr:bifunctional riboflavin kinase/FAD synthetase [Catenulisporales bacterium]OLE25999.1 MAG: bifunctional riboflavin kinase/FMN adenylyltransferase [Catenulispora sp. 13_1_20CM_3_70_7]
MERWHGTAEVPQDFGPSVVTIGVFDGVHRGHREVVRTAVAKGRELGLPTVVLTFDPHPSEIVRPGSHPPLLTTQRHRAELLAAEGVDAVLVLPFSLDMSRWSPEEFVRTVLVEALHARAVVVGANFRFGHRAAGDAAALEYAGGRYGFEVVPISLKGPGGPEGLSRSEPSAEPTRVIKAASDNRFSSTRVRALIAGGVVAEASVMLGRPHRVEGVVVRGDQRGRELGYPTANVETVPFAAIPSDGVYAGWLITDVDKPEKSFRHPAAISIGTNPTFDGTERRVEAYALDRDDLDLYGTHVAVEFAARIRDTLKFDSVEALLDRMADDCKVAREITDEAA